MVATLRDRYPDPGQLPFTYVPMPPEKARQIRFQTPAKINTFLFIQKKRPDGYHELVMDLIPVSLFDVIEISESARETLELDSNLTGVPTEKNLVIKAVRILEEETRHRFSLTIKLTKFIPSGAGLGGGSGNAAGMLKVLNRWYRLGLSDHRLRHLALKLGADVPFFINPRPSLAKGIGERLIELPPFEPLNVLLIYPGFPISTKVAYAHCRISGRQQTVQTYSSRAFSGRSPTINDFWASLKKIHPELSACQQALLSEGAVFSGLSGSGSTVFGIFEDEHACKHATARISRFPHWRTVQCKTLTRHSYVPIGQPA